MLWFNNHSWDQENFYSEARQMMREQRRAQNAQNQQNASPGHSVAVLFGAISPFAFLFCLIYTHDIMLSLGLLLVLFIVGCCFAGKADEEPKKPVYTHPAKPHKKEEYTDDSF